MNILNKTKEFLNKKEIDFTKSKVLKLQEVLKYHNELYYSKGEPIISDFEYDSLFKKLLFLEKKFNIINKATSEVGANIKESTFQKVKHSRSMISLDNTYNEEDLNDFDLRVKKLLGPGSDKDIEYTIEFKFDGLGVELIYKDGNLIQAITRGNGVEGEDITENIMMIDNIPKTISYKDTLEVRGEVVMPISSFESINKKAKNEGGKIFSNTRNAASGSLRTLDTSVTKERKLKYFGYDLANFREFIERENKNIYFDVINSIDDLGFETSSYFIKCNSITEVIKQINNFGNIKNEIDFDIDGLVIKVNNISFWGKIGSTEHHPRYAIAYKFPAEILTTQIIGIEHGVGRTGTITPVAHLEPINIGGVIVKRASLHNYDEIKKLGIKLGDNIFIKRAGEVIPKVISVIKEERTGNEKKIRTPKICPSCSSEVIKDDSKVRYYCSNILSCGAQIRESLAYSVGKQGFNIDGLGERQIKIFLDEGLIFNLFDIFNLKNKREELLSLEGFQEKSVDNLFESIEKSKNIPISHFITALGIPGVGKKTSKELAKVLKSREDILDFKLKIEDLELLSDIGTEIAKDVYKYFTNTKKQELLINLLDILNIEYINESQVLTNGFFSGKKVCITGSFDNHKRDDLIKKLEGNSGEFMSSVSKNTNYLLAGEKAGSKLKKAKELGVEILTLEKFLENLK